MANIGSWLKQIIDALLNSPSNLSEEDRRRAGAAVLQQRERAQKRHDNVMRQLQERTHKRVHPRGPGHR
jgi:hypothetical protein